MKLSQAKDYLPFVQAAAEGKTIQRRSGAEWKDWVDANNCAFDLGPECYRIKTEPRLRAWKPKEVPVGARYRRTGQTQYCQTILGYTPKGVTVSMTDCYDTLELKAFQEMVDLFEHSLDNGKTWLPCGVEESQ